MEISRFTDEFVVFLEIIYIYLFFL